MPKALIAGAYGQGNPGDEALLAALGPVVAASGFDPIVTSGDPAATERRYAYEAVAPRGLRAVRAVAGSKAVVVGGGTVFKELHPSTRRRPDSLVRNTAALVMTTVATGRPIAFVGIGAAPIRSAISRRLVRFSAQAADLLVLRDEESADELNAAGVPSPFRVGADPAWTVLDPGARPGGSTPDGPLLVVLSHLAGDHRTLEALGETLRRLGATGMSIQLMPWQRADVPMAREVLNMLGGQCGLGEPPDDLTQACHLADGCSAVLALRFHAALASAVAGVPFVAVSHEPKLTAIARRLGMPAVSPLASAPVMVEAVHDAVTREIDPALVWRERERAEGTLSLLRLVLSSGDLVDDVASARVELVSPGP